MKTAMQELINELEQKRDIWRIDGNATDRKIRGSYVDAIIIAKKLIHQEKQQIIEAVQHGLWNNEVVEIANYSKIYYDSTFSENVT